MAVHHALYYTGSISITVHALSSNDINLGCVAIQTWDNWLRSANTTFEFTHPHLKLPNGSCPGDFLTVR